MHTSQAAPAGCLEGGRGQGPGLRAQSGVLQEESPCAPSLASCGFWEEQAVPAQACGLGKRSMWDTVFPDKMRQSLSQPHCSAREHLCNPRPAPHEPLALAPPAAQLPPPYYTSAAPRPVQTSYPLSHSPGPCSLAPSGPSTLSVAWHLPQPQGPPAPTATPAFPQLP